MSDWLSVLVRDVVLLSLVGLVVYTVVVLAIDTFESYAREKKRRKARGQK